MRDKKGYYYWGVMWHSKCELDGESKHLIHGNFVPHLFRTRAEARAWAIKNYSYMKTRKDLRAEPHGWRMPYPVKVEVRERP